jgi:hypothetical protein
MKTVFGKVFEIETGIWHDTSDSTKKPDKYYINEKWELASLLYKSFEELRGKKSTKNTKFNFHINSPTSLIHGFWEILICTYTERDGYYKNYCIYPNGKRVVAKMIFGENWINVSVDDILETQNTAFGKMLLVQSTTSHINADWVRADLYEEKIDDRKILKIFETIHTPFGSFTQVELVYSHWWRSMLGTNKKPLFLNDSLVVNIKISEKKWEKMYLFSLSDERELLLSETQAIEKFTPVQSVVNEVSRKVENIVPETEKS